MFKSTKCAKKWPKCGSSYYSEVPYKSALDIPVGKGASKMKEGKYAEIESLKGLWIKTTFYFRLRPDTFH